MRTWCRLFTESVPKLTRQVRRLGSTVARLKLKGIDGGPHKRWSMWFNSTQREEPYLGLNCRGYSQKREVSFGNRGGGAAWLSSARVVRCWVKSRNERNPRPVLPKIGTRRRPPATSWRKVGTTSSHHGLYVQGYTRATMVGTTGCEVVRRS